MGLSGIAKQTVEIVQRGEYVAPSGRTVSMLDGVERAKKGTRLYRPSELEALAANAPASTTRASRPAVSVTPETTSAAGRRLVVSERASRVLILNFASAKNPGGGFLGGAKAQEEDLARASALYACQLTQPDYYAANRACGSMLYTDHMIYSPDVPFFRDDALDLVEEPYALSVITAPAPNAGEHARRDPNHRDVVNATLRGRAAHVLRVACAHEHRVLVLGAWGCGVFKNDPVFVATAFAELLASKELAGAFERVVFAIYDRSKAGATFRAFQERFAAPL
jgi:uncharacterized protein (TIGR02452 family)